MWKNRASGGFPGRLLAFLVLAGVAGLVFLMKRDVSLLEEFMKTQGTAPKLPLTLERVSISRNVEENLWTVRTPRLERLGEQVRAVSLEVELVDEERRRYVMVAETGMFDEEFGDVLLERVRGEVEFPSGGLRFVAPKGTWNRGDGRLVFPEGVFAEENEKTTLRAGAGWILPGGSVFLSGDVVVEWEEP